MLTSAVHSPPTIFETVDSFTDVAEGMADLHLHKVVDETVDALQATAKVLNGHATLGRAIEAVISKQPVTAGEYLDPDDELIDSLSAMVDRYEEHLAVMTAKKGCIDQDERLNESHCDMLHTSYDDVLNAIACLIEVAKDMRACIVTRDLAAEPRGQSAYGNVFEMKRALGA